MVPDGGYKYILNYQDCFSKFVILRALKTKTAAKVADCLVNIFFGELPYVQYSKNNAHKVTHRPTGSAPSSHPSVGRRAYS